MQTASRHANLDTARGDGIVGKRQTARDRIPPREVAHEHGDAVRRSGRRPALYEIAAEQTRGTGDEDDAVAVRGVEGRTAR